MIQFQSSDSKLLSFGSTSPQIDKREFNKWLEHQEARFQICWGEYTQSLGNIHIICFVKAVII